MRSRDSVPQRGYYFALPRLCSFVRGRDAKRTDQNWLEAYFGGIAVFVVSYAAFLTLFDAGVLLAIALLFVTWVAWVVVFYLNSAVVKTLRGSGTDPHSSDARAQSVIIGIETSACAIILTTQRGWAVLGWAWLLLAIANVSATVVLRMLMQRDA